MAAMIALGLSGNQIKKLYAALVKNPKNCYCEPEFPSVIFLERRSI